MTKPKAESAAQISRNGVQPDYYTMIPNMAFKDLKPNAFKLLAVYLDISKTGDVYAKNSTIAKLLGASVNTMKAARKELVDKGYILLAPGKDGAETKTASITIQIAWMWQENHTQHTVSKSDTPLSNSDTLLSNSDTNNQDLNTKTDISSSIVPMPTATPKVTTDETQDVTVSQAKQLISVYKSYSKNADKSMLGWALDDAKTLVKASITPEHIKVWYAEKSQDAWIKDKLNGVPTWRMLVTEIIAWRDKKNQVERPALKQYTPPPQQSEADRQEALKRMVKPVINVKPPMKPIPGLESDYDNKAG